MASPISISFSEEMNTSDVLDSWLKSLSQDEANEAMTRKLMLKTNLNDGPSHRLTMFSSSPTLPTVSCPPSPLTRSEMSESSSFDLDSELRIGRRSWERSVSPCHDRATTSMHDSKLSIAPPEEPISRIHPAHARVKPISPIAADFLPLPLHLSTSTPTLYTPGEPSPYQRHSMLRSPTNSREDDQVISPERFSRAGTPSKTLVVSSASEDRSSTYFGDSRVPPGCTELIAQTSVPNYENDTEPRQDHDYAGCDIETETTKRGSSDQLSDLMIQGLQSVSTKQTLCNTKPERQSPQLGTGPYFLSPTKFALSGNTSNIENTTGALDYLPDSSIWNVNEESWIGSPHLSQGSPIPPPKNEPNHDNVHILNLICKSTTTTSAMFGGGDMPVAGHDRINSSNLLSRKPGGCSTKEDNYYRPLPQSPSRYGTADEQDKSHAPQDSYWGDTATKTDEIFVDYRTNAPPLPPLPFPRSLTPVPSTPDHESLKRKRMISLASKTVAAELKTRPLPKLTSNMISGLSTEHNKANSKAIRKTIILPPFKGPTRSRLQKRPPLLNPIQSTVNNQPSPRSILDYQLTPRKTRSPSRDVTIHQISPQDTTNYQVSTRHTINRQISLPNITSHQIPPHNITSYPIPSQHITTQQTSSPRPTTRCPSPRHVTFQQRSPQTAVTHRHHHHPSPSQSSNTHQHPSPHGSTHSSTVEQTAHFDTRLKVLEKQNEFLSAALVAVMETGGKLIPLPPAEQPPRRRPAQWESRVARRLAATCGHVAATAAASSLSPSLSRPGRGTGLGISMGDRRRGEDRYS